MTRKYNFSAGPAMLPRDVLERAQQEMLEWNDNKKLLHFCVGGGVEIGGGGWGAD